MKIAIASTFPLNDSRVTGGVQSAVLYLARALAHLPDTEVRVFTLGPAEWSGPNPVARDGFSVEIMSPHPRFERLRAFRNFRRAFNQHMTAWQPDIVHGQDATLYSYAALRSGLPAVITAHGIRREDGRYYGDFGRRVRNWYDSQVIERWIMGRTRNLIAISSYVTRYFSGRLHPQARVAYIPNAIDARFFELGKAEQEALNAGPTILFAGSVIPRKRVLNLVQSFARIAGDAPTARLHIAGETNSEPVYVAAVRAEIASAGLENRVRLLGALDEIHLLHEFSDCDLLALPSAQETTPMVLAQAMAAGKPCLATQVGGVEEMLGAPGQRGILVPPGDDDALAHGLLRLLTDPDLRRRLGSEGRAFACREYAADAVARRTYDVYRQAVEEAGDG